MTKFTLSLLTATAVAGLLGAEAQAAEVDCGRAIPKSIKELSLRSAGRWASGRFAEEAEGGVLYSCSFDFLKEGTEAEPAPIELDDWDNIPEELIGEDNYGFGGQGIMQAGGAVYIPFEYDEDPDSEYPWYVEGLMWTPDLYEPMQVVVEMDVKITDGCGYETDELWIYANDYYENFDYDSGEISTEWTHLSLNINAKSFEPESDDDSYYFTFFAEGGADILVKNIVIKDKNAVQSGVNEIVAGDREDVAVRYYNMQGQEIAKPAKGTPVIKVSGAEASKVVF
ncbi:MAG: hypothetical protein K2M12_02035 [Muribaculaceae bacterium]|nr:hypothetical protein [Muribaculaceae bacterium]